MARTLVFHARAWEDYLYFQETDKKLLSRINALIKEIQRTPFEGTGKPEPLKHEYKGCWSRRINSEHRLIYMVSSTDVIILQCRYHY